MKKTKVQIALILVLILVSVGCFQLAKYQKAKYPAVLEKIDQIENAKSTVTNNSSSYKNENEKYDRAKARDNFYYGYEHFYLKDDIFFFSTHEDWGEDKLSELAEELYQNKHGEEMKYLEKVVVYGSSGGDAAGAHSESINSYEIPVAIYNLFPKELKYNALYEQSSIYIYGITEETEVEDIAAVLSHEYGHHFTQYHFNLKFTDEDKETEYYKLRAQGIDEIVLDRETYEHYIDKHQWYLAEIAAEDYVYLMGSETTKRIVEFYDNKEKYDIFLDKYVWPFKDIKYPYTWCRNGTPHENADLEMPFLVDGLAEYFYSFVDENPFEYTMIDGAVGSLNLTARKDGANQHFFTWDQPYTDPEIIYTLIGYDENDSIAVIVKTTTGNENGAAYLGDYVYNRMWSYNLYYEYYIAIKFDSGSNMKFRVSITFPDGTVYMSDPIDIVY